MTGTPKDPAEIAAADQLQAEAHLGVEILYIMFKRVLQHSPTDMATAKRLTIEAIEKVHLVTPWTPGELMHALAEAFAMLYRAETSGATASEQPHTKGSSDA